MSHVANQNLPTFSSPSRSQDIVLITGATGAIGSILTERLSQRYQVVGLDRTCEGKPNCLEVDITSAQALQKTCHLIRQRYGNRIASVIHLAAYFDMTGEPNKLYEEVNIHGTKNLIEALKQFEVEQFIYSSTMLVHASTQPGAPFDESWPIEPKWPYPKSKVDAENALHAVHEHIPLVIFRIAGMYSDHCHSATLAQQIQRIYERTLLSHVFPGNIHHGQAFIHMDDLSQAFIQAIERRKTLPPDITFLIGEPHTMSYAELQNDLASLIHGEKEWETIEIPKNIAKTGAWLQDKLEEIVPDAIDKGEEPFIKPFMIDLADDHFELDISRAAQKLEWQPKLRLKTVLPKMVAALKENPAKWYQENHLNIKPSSPAKEISGLNAAERRILKAHEAHMEQQRRNTLWAHFANMALGAWLISSPFALGFRHEAAMSVSDILSGILILLFSFFSLSKSHGWAQWANTFVGIWLLFAPLVFWTTSPAAYVNDTLIGTLVIAFAILIPHMPGMSMRGMALGPDIPPGWSYSPSDWTQRLPIIGLALVGFFLSRYLAAYQLGHIPAAWDPFFGRGTEIIITSEVSKAWPIADAGLGALSYIIEALSGAMGDRRRWRTMPWMVGMFGFLIVPLGGVSIFFIIIQPIVIGTWCTICLIAAAAMVIMIPYSLDELVATGQFLKERLRQGKPFWTTFFRGDSMPGNSELRSFEFNASPKQIIKTMLSDGVSTPWNLNVCALIGVILMCSRLLFNTQGEAANSDHLIGALVIVFSISAWAEVGRALRYINIPFGAWLIVAPFLLSGETEIGAIADVIAGIALILLSLPRGKIYGRYGEWDRLIV